MSRPISSCAIIKAALGDEKAFAWMVEAMFYNRSQIAYTIFPCECQPPCAQPTDEQMDAFRTRLNEAVDAKVKVAEAKAKAEREEYARKHPRREVGDFSKYVFPIIENVGTVPKKWWV